MTKIFWLTALTVVLALGHFLTQPHSQPNFQSPGAYGANKLRNSSFVSWAAGSGISGATGTCGDGVIVNSTGGAGVVRNRVANPLATPLSFWACQVVGATSVTDVSARWVIESVDAATLASQPVTCQFPIRNEASVTLSPTLSVYSATAQDNYAGFNTEVNAVALQTIAASATVTLAYTFTPSASAINGLSINVDFGNAFGASSNKLDIGGGFNCRITPGASTGQVNAVYLLTPDIPSASVDVQWNERFYQSTWGNTISAGTATHNGIQCAFAYDSGTAKYKIATFPFRTQMRAAPSTVTLYDGAGNSNLVSFMENQVWTDGVSPGANFTFNAYDSSLQLLFGNSGAGFNDGHVCAHYAVNATITGH